MNKILFLILITFVSCRKELDIKPIDPKYSKDLVNKEIIQPSLDQAKILSKDSFFYPLNSSLGVFHSQFPNEFRKFESLQGDKERANFLKRNHKFRKIWKKLGNNEKKLNSINSIKTYQ